MSPLELVTDHTLKKLQAFGITTDEAFMQLNEVALSLFSKQRGVGTRTMSDVRYVMNECGIGDEQFKIFVPQPEYYCSHHQCMHPADHFSYQKNAQGETRPLTKCKEYYRAYHQAYQRIETVKPKHKKHNALEFVFGPNHLHSLNY